MEFIGVPMADKVYDAIGQSIYDHYPDACVLYIDEVKNDVLYNRYLARKEAMIAQRGIDNVKELCLFHGTKHCNINGIATDGFKAEFNKTSAFGVGTYFSTSARYSKNYMDADRDDVSYMFVCDVLVGKTVQGVAQKRLDMNLYDTGVDNVVKPGMYICPKDDTSYPRYLVAFHKNAK